MFVQLLRNGIVLAFVASSINIYFSCQPSSRKLASCEELISMLITLKVIILNIIQVIISMQTSVKMGMKQGGWSDDCCLSMAMESSLHGEKSKIENLPLVARRDGKCH